VPLVLIALADADQYHVTVLPGRGFARSHAILNERIRLLFEPTADTRHAEAVPFKSKAGREPLAADAAYAKR
jgi:hypothetical protein